MFKGKIVIITGGASGIGLACTEGYAKNGAVGVLLADVQEEKGKREAERISRETGCDARCFKTNVADETSVKAMVKYAIDTWGKIDILINDASICRVVSWDKTTKESWDEIIAINLTGMFLCTKEVGVYMKKQSSGRILFITSTAALDGSHIAHVGYGVTKAGAVALMKTAAKEFAPYNVFASAVMAGPIDTALSKGFTEEQRANFAKGNLMKRYGQPSEVAEAVMFMTSPKASFITGATLQVSGGEILFQRKQTAKRTV